MTSSTNERAITKSRDRAKRERDDDRAYLLSLMSTPKGRAWMWRRLRECRVFIADEDLNHAVLAWNAGQRNVGLRHLAELLSVCPQSYVQMLVENSSAPLDQPQEEEIEQ